MDIQASFTSSLTSRRLCETFVIFQVAKPQEIIFLMLMTFHLMLLFPVGHVFPCSTFVFQVRGIYTNPTRYAFVINNDEMANCVYAMPNSESSAPSPPPPPPLKVLATSLIPTYKHACLKVKVSARLEVRLGFKNPAEPSFPVIFSSLPYSSFAHVVITCH